MPTARTNGWTRSTLLGIFCLAPLAHAGGPLPLSGSILGEVKTVTGIAEMGAKVLLYDRHEQLVRQVLTNDQGRFWFAALNPDVYSIRVTLASFVPALRRNISVAAGTENLLEINLSGIFSTVDLLSSPAHGTLMGDDWKWVLRSAPATRPILRFLPEESSSSRDNSSSIFSETEGILRVTAGDSDSLAGPTEQDLGTAFALATSIYDRSRLQLSGNVGTNGILPAMGFRTTYSRTTDSGSNPEITVSMRQMYLTAGPALHEASLGVYDHLDLGDRVHLEYGFNYETVTFIDHLNILSPFARATYDMGPHSSVRVAFSSGTQPGQLLSREIGAADDTLGQDLAALAMAPRVSLSDARTRVERRDSLDATYQYVAGSRTYSLGLYHEAVTNAAFLLSGPTDFLPSSDLLTQLGSTSQVFNAGSYQRTGFNGSVRQSIGKQTELMLAAGRTGALLTGENSAADANALRDAIHTVQRTWLEIRVTKTLPVTGTRVTSSYGWTDFKTLMPSHLSMTDQTTQDTGWNVYIRQPLPALPGVFGSFGRFEATAELRNLLAQGYLPMVANNQQAVLTSAPRALRGGTQFYFLMRLYFRSFRQKSWSLSR